MVSDMDQVVERLLAVKWDDDAAFEHRASRARLAREFLRRTAQWAAAVGAEDEWPFGDLAAAVAPEVQVPGEVLKRLETDPAEADAFPVPPAMAANIVKWAALGELPRERFPQLDDPYEPLLALFERGGGYTRGPGKMIELGFTAFPIGSLAERAALEPAPIDAATLDLLDQES